MTPAEIIEEVLSDLVRPDLGDRARVKFAQTVRAVHAIDQFRQDLTLHMILDPDPIDKVVRFSVSETIPRFRKISSVRLYTDYAHVNGMTFPEREIILPDEGFVNGVEKLKVRDYFGFRYPFTYSIVGDVGGISGVSSNVKCIEIVALTYPEVKVDPVDGELSTDSWIVRDCPELVQAQLKWEIAKLIQDRETKRNAEETIMFERDNFLRQHLNDTIEV